MSRLGYGDMGGLRKGERIDGWVWMRGLNYIDDGWNMCMYVLSCRDVYVEHI